MTTLTEKLLELKRYRDSTADSSPVAISNTEDLFKLIKERIPVYSPPDSFFYETAVPYPLDFPLLERKLSELGFAVYITRSNLYDDFHTTEGLTLKFTLIQRLKNYFNA